LGVKTIKETEIYTQNTSRTSKISDLTKKEISVKIIYYEWGKKVEKIVKTKETNLKTIQISDLG